jgi:hypothetical protein
MLQDKDRIVHYNYTMKSITTPEAIALLKSLIETPSFSSEEDKQPFNRKLV